MTMAGENITAKNRAALRDAHIGSPYYAAAENWLSAFWSEDGIFFPHFKKLDLKSTVDLACGHGRHTQKIVDHAGHVTVVDINKSNIDACRKRFADRENVSYVVNSGCDLSGIKNNAVTSLFCYDAMVHFEAFDVISYVQEIARILARNGKALLHYSVDDTRPEQSYEASPHWRNYFSQSLMHHVASRSGLRIAESETFPWPVGTSGPHTDGLVLLQKE